MLVSYVDGRFCQPGGTSFPALEAATGDALSDIAEADGPTVSAAVVAARGAFDDGPWPRLQAAVRASYLRAFADALEEQSDKIARIESRDTGMPLVYTEGGHLPRTIAHFRHFAAECERIVGDAIPVDGAYINLVTREPVGVTVVIVPWNSPLTIASMSVAAALATGNTCILKPSEHASLSLDVLARIADAIELPPGVLNVVYGGVDTGRALVSDERVDAISFTGGTQTGRAIVRSAPNIARLTLELGGKSPTIVFGDADLDAALDGAILAAFASNGEACMAGTRLLVERPIYDAFVRRFAERADAVHLGDPCEASTEMGPLITPAHARAARALVDTAVNAGARTVTARRDAIPPYEAYFPPTVLTGLASATPLLRQEAFAPVVCAIPFDDELDAIRIGNATEFGLAAYVWSADNTRAMRVAGALRAGSVMINSPMIRDIRAPFGGYKNSGLGRVGGRYSLEAFTELKTTCIPVAPYALPRLGAAPRREVAVG